MVAPDLVEQRLAGDDQPLVAHQVLEQLELAGRELDVALAAEDLAGVGIEAQVANHEEGAAARRAPAQQGSQAGQQLVALEGLDEVVVGAGVEPGDAGLDARRGR